MKIYIAGKISGDSQYRAKFQAVEQELTSGGATVINPAILPAGLSSADYMRICFSMIDSADMVLFLPDYADSKGAMLEWSWCQYVEKPTAFRAEQCLSTIA